jgi:hypothetical protein
MLELRPSCEHCNKTLPPESSEAMICSYECTFCRRCVSQVLQNVCPNCGGGFVPRPIRPAREWRPGISCSQQLPGTRVVHNPVDPKIHADLVASQGGLAPELR